MKVKVKVKVKVKFVSSCLCLLRYYNAQSTELKNHVSSLQSIKRKSIEIVGEVHLNVSYGSNWSASGNNVH
jgi:hypothetical protein